jgi:hypothetical protein
MEFVENDSEISPSRDSNVQYMSSLNEIDTSVSLPEPVSVPVPLPTQIPIPRTSNDILRADRLTRGPKYGIIVVDNFYNNPMETRDFILRQEFSVKGNYPGQRTVSYANEHLKEIIQRYVEPFAGKITDFPIPTGASDEKIYNGAFQYTTSRDRSWVHMDGYNNWAGIIYMTPDAPLSSGTGFFRFHDGSMDETDATLLNNKTATDNFSQDMTKWDLVDKVGNVFNRLILFNSKKYHMSLDYFGDSKENGRLFQTFFFSTEK